MVFAAAPFKQDLQGVIADLGETVTHSSTDYTAVVTTPERGREHELAGFLPDDDLGVLILNDDFGTLPVLGEKITYDSRTYRIVRITDSNDSVSSLLACEEVSA